MFFILSKLLSFAIAPIIWIITLLFLALFANTPKKRKWRLSIALILTLLFTNPFIFHQCMSIWEVPARQLTENESYEVAIVLGGMFSYNQDLKRITFKQSSDRFLQALELYNLGKVKKILISGGSGSLVHPELKESLLLKKYLLTIGLPEEDLWIESESKNTRENAVNSVAFLKEKGVTEKVLLCTSGFHMKRATACFEKAGLETTAYGTDIYHKKLNFNPDAILVPYANHLADWTLFIHELVGYATYKVVGYA